MRITRREFNALLAGGVTASCKGKSVQSEQQSIIATKTSPYGELDKDGNFNPYSWDKIKAILNLEKADEKSFHERLVRRYSELTATYENAIRETERGVPDFALLLGTEKIFARPSEKDLPDEYLKIGIDMNELLTMPAKRLRDEKKRLSYETGEWSLAGATFFHGNKIISPYGRIPRHMPDGSTREDAPFYYHILLEKFSGGVKGYSASVNADGGLVPRSVGFGHPFGIGQTYSDSGGITGSWVSGEGIFQKGVHEYIEIPAGSPLESRIHEKYRKHYKLLGLQKQDREIVDGFFNAVYRSVKKADERLGKA